MTKEGLKLLVDTSNLHTGGGIIHFKNLLRVAEPQEFGFEKIIVYGGRIPLDHLPQRNWLQQWELPELNRSWAQRFWWQQRELKTS